MCLIPVGHCIYIPTYSVIFLPLINHFRRDEIKINQMDKVARIRDSRRAYWALIKKPEGKRLLGVDGWILLKWTLK